MAEDALSTTSVSTGIATGTLESAQDDNKTRAAVTIPNVMLAWLVWLATCGLTTQLANLSWVKGRKIAIVTMIAKTAWAASL